MGVAGLGVERARKHSTPRSLAVEPPRPALLAGETRMKFYFPDSQDQVDPSFDFVTEQRSATRVRQRDDLYAHEALRAVPYGGMLVSKAIVDGIGSGAGRYTFAQRHRLYREGVRRFYRLDAFDG